MGDTVRNEATVVTLEVTQGTVRTLPHGTEKARTEHAW